MFCLIQSLYFSNDQAESMTASNAVIAASSITLTETQEKTNNVQIESSDYSTNDKSTEPNSTSENIALPLHSPQRYVQYVGFSLEDVSKNVSILVSGN